MRKILVLAAVVLPVALVHAERPPQSRDKADLVVVGTIEKVTKKESKFGGDGIMTNYTALVKLDKVERGEEVKPGETVQVHWFHVTRTPSRPLPGAYGHAHRLQARDQARFWLMKREKGTWDVIYNSNGVEKLKK